MDWKIATIGGVLALTIGVAIVAVGTQPFEGGDYRGVPTTMAIVCYLGCLPALLVPLLWMAYRRRTDRKPFVRAAVRKLGKGELAKQIANEISRFDPLDHWTRCELSLLTGSSTDLNHILRGDV